MASDEQVRSIVLISASVRRFVKAAFIERFYKTHLRELFVGAQISAWASAPWQVGLEICLDPGKKNPVHNIEEHWN